MHDHDSYGGGDGLDTQAGEFLGCRDGKIPGMYVRIYEFMSLLCFNSPDYADFY